MEKTPSKYRLSYVRTWSNFAKSYGQTPRGIRGYELLGDVDFDTWKIQGNLGGEDFPDKVRGPLNEGGLFVEREGRVAFITTLYNTMTNISSRSTLTWLPRDLMDPILLLHPLHGHQLSRHPCLSHHI